MKTMENSIWQILISSISYIKMLKPNHEYKHTLHTCTFAVNKISFDFNINVLL